jgi:hypothetical protein
LAFLSNLLRARSITIVSLLYRKDLLDLRPVDIMAFFSVQHLTLCWTLSRLTLAPDFCTGNPPRLQCPVLGSKFLTFTSEISRGCEPDGFSLV